MDHLQKAELINTNEALNLLLQRHIDPPKTQLLSLDKALGAVLATKVISPINVPGFNNSAMDGYALHLRNEQINTPGRLVFSVTDRITAGSIGNTLAQGCAARIFTGAPIPKGANTVIMQEECEPSEDKAVIATWRPLSLNENIRFQGNDILKDATILQPGRLLKPQDIALAASVGVAELKVFKKIKVGVFFTGDELVEPGNVLHDGKIFNSNRYALVALLEQLGCEVVNLGNIKDDFDSTANALQTLAQNCDLIITTGGVSVGEEDYIKSAVESLGKLDLWRINMKPGKPLAFGSIDDCAFMGLPGNPVSAMVTFLLFVRPLIKKMQGVEQYQNLPTQVKCNFAWHQPNSRREFVRVQLDLSTQPNSVNLYLKQGSDILSSMVWADGLLEIPEKTTFKQGEILNFYPFNEMMT